MSDPMNGKKPKRTTGKGTTKDPKIMWMVPHPRLPCRLDGNEEVARQLGAHGYTHIWIRSCDHTTIRKIVNGQKQTISADSHITVYAGTARRAMAEKQGDVFLVNDGGSWRIMDNNERFLPVDENGKKGVELYPWPQNSRES